MNSKELQAEIQAFFSKEKNVLEWGVAPVKKPPFAKELKQWVARGFHAGMKYMEKNLSERTDPAVFQPWAKSIILFSFPYPFTLGTAKETEYRIASYALSTDYHMIGKQILNRLETFLKNDIQVESMKLTGFVDASPVFERELAAEAGLGWRGKNCCLLNKKYGSAFFIAGCFLNVKLPFGKPQKDHCGKCTKCLDACPTGALADAGLLDARKCISYHTIENKDYISCDTAKFGNWIFGCDICQEVCPWNKKPSIPLSTNPPDSFLLNGIQWLQVLRNGGGFQKRFKNTALVRAGRKMMLRNLALAARNRGDESTMDKFEQLLTRETDPLVQKEIKKTVALLERRAQFKNN
jgi:epoxyqueuosine reductase